MEREHFNHTLNGDASAVGIIASGSAANAEGVSSAYRKRKQKEALNDFVNLMLNSIQQVEKLLVETENTIKEARASLTSLQSYALAMSNHDMGQVRTLLQHDGYSLAELGSDEQVLATVRAHITDQLDVLEEQTQTVFEASQRILESDVSTEEQKARANIAVAEAKSLEANLESQRVLYNPTLSQGSMLQELDFETSRNELAASSDLSLSQNQDSSTSFASEIFDNAFEASAPKISGLFNSASQGTPYTTPETELEQKRPEQQAPALHTPGF